MRKLVISWLSFYGFINFNLNSITSIGLLWVASSVQHMGLLISRLTLKNGGISCFAGEDAYIPHSVNSGQLYRNRFR